MFLHREEGGFGCSCFQCCLLPGSVDCFALSPALTGFIARLAASRRSSTTVAGTSGREQSYVSVRLLAAEPYLRVARCVSAPQSLSSSLPVPRSSILCACLNGMPYPNESSRAAGVGVSHGRMGMGDWRQRCRRIFLDASRRATRTWWSVWTISCPACTPAVEAV